MSKKYFLFHFFSFAIDLILFKLASNEDIYCILDDFKFEPDWTTDCGVSYPWTGEPSLETLLMEQTASCSALSSS